MVCFLDAHISTVKIESDFIKSGMPGYGYFQKIEDASEIYPKTAQEITARSRSVQQKALGLVKDIIDSALLGHCSKDALFDGYDSVFFALKSEIYILKLMQNVHPNNRIRQEAEKQSINLQTFFIEQVEGNKALYEAFRKYSDSVEFQRSLSSEQSRLLQKIMNDFKRAGLGCSDEDRLRVLELKKSCTELESTFHKCIREDDAVLSFTKEELDGVGDSLNDFVKKGDLYQLDRTRSTRDTVKGLAKNEETRKRYMAFFNTKAYPANKGVLEQLAEKRNALAKLLGFESYAHYNLADQMIQTPERALKFEHDLLGFGLEGARKEFCSLVEEFPEGVTLTNSGMLEDHNETYVQDSFNKRKYPNLKRSDFSHYFTFESVMQGLIFICESFFSITIEKVPSPAVWHQDVALLKISKKENQEVCGYIFLDMFSRENKGPQFQCYSCISSLKKENVLYPGVATVICNFSKPLDEKPLFLSYYNMRSIFHEFGHALHFILGAPRYAAHLSYEVERDFLEFPSQLLECWAQDFDILKMISCHYQTGEKIADDFLRNYFQYLGEQKAMHVMWEVATGLDSLAFFGPGENKNLFELQKKNKELCCPYISYDADYHFYCSFWHLVDYGAGVYCYLWSRSLAYDAFEYIKEQGLLDPEVGKKYTDMILAHGASKDANQMIRDFLGREPGVEAFHKRIAL